MSTEAPTWYVEQYKAGVLYQFQSDAHVLRGTYMPPAKIDGKTLYFPIAGKGTATEMVIGADAKPMNAGRTRKSVTTKAYQAYELINEVDLERMSTNEKEVAQRQAAMALGRRHDKVVYDAVHGGAGTYGTVRGNAGGAWTLGDALQAATDLFKKDVPEDGRAFCGLPQQAFSQMMTYEEFNNSQWVGGDMPFAKVRRAKAWAGVNWFTLPEELFPTAANVTTFYLWHFNSIGAGYNGQELNTRISWENSKTAWAANNWMDLGATVLLPEGVVQCQYLSTSTLSAFTAG
jgi:hypothetical protein